MRSYVAASWVLSAGLIASGLAHAEPPTPVDPPVPTVASSTAVVAPPRAPTQDELQLARENAEVIRLAEQETGHLSPPTRDPDANRATTMWGALLQMVVVLGGVSLLAYLLLGKLLPKLMRVPSPTGRPRLMRVVDRLAIDQRRSILLISVGDQHFLVGNSEGGIHLISPLDSETVLRAESNAEQQPSGLSRLKEALTGQGSKES